MPRFLLARRAVPPGGPTPSQTFASVDAGGATWTPVADLAALGFPVEVGAYEAGAFASGSAGVFYSADARTAWQPVAGNLPAGALAVYDGHMYASVYASDASPSPGVWRRPFAGVVAGEAEPEAGRALVVSVDGRRVLEPQRHAFAAGEHRIALDVSRLAPGVYAVVVQAGAETATTRLTVAR